jgi:hypothetical protein
MSDVALPKIKVTDAQNLDGSTTGTSGVDSPSTTTDGQSTRPRSTTSSEGMVSVPHFTIYSFTFTAYSKAIKDVPMLYSHYCAYADEICCRRQSTIK